MTIGEYLKRIREEKKITLEQVAEGTKIRIQFLKAIEEDRLNDLPSLSQAKGFCRLYASFLGLNPVQVFDDVEKANRPVENLNRLLNPPKSSQLRWLLKIMKPDRKRISPE